MANVSEIVMIVRSCTQQHHHLLKLTKLHVDIIFWLARGFTYKNMACKLKTSYGNIHGNIVWLYYNTRSCDKATFLTWVQLNKVLIPKNGELVLNEELMVKKESG